jgi:hypothetical protein
MTTSYGNMVRPPPLCLYILLKGTLAALHEMPFQVAYLVELKEKQGDDTVVDITDSQ